MKHFLLSLFALMTVAVGATARVTTVADTNQVSDGEKIPYVVWCAGNGILFFTMRSETIAVGDTFTAENGNEYTVSNVWSGDQVVNSPQYSSPGWNASSMRNSIGEAVFESSFKDARPKSLYGWFSYDKYLSYLTGLENLNTSAAVTMAYMFYYCQYLSGTIDLSHFDTGKVERMGSMFMYCIYLTKVTGMENWNTSSVQNIDHMFSLCYRLTSVGDLSGWDTSNVTNMTNMFNSCRSLESLDLSGWTTDNVTSINGMFYDCRVLTTVGDLGGWHLDKATSTTDMFKQCYKLETLDVSHFGMGSVRTMDGMFRQCFALQALDVSNWDVSNVTNFNSTFCGLSKVTTLDLSRWHSTRATAMFGMFMDSSALTELDLSGFYTSNVTNMNCMFLRCTALESVTVNNLWSVANAASTATEMFKGCEAIVGQDGTTYDSNAIDASKAHYGAGGYLRHGTDVDLGTQPYAIYDAAATTLYLLQSDQTLTANDTFTPAGTDAPVAISNIWYGKDVCETADNGGQRVGYYLPWTSTVNSKATKVVVQPSFAGVRPTNTEAWFNYFSVLTDIEGLANINMSEVTSTSDMFGSCSALQTIPGIEQLDMSHVSDAGFMFGYCSQLQSLDVGGWDVSQLEDASEMFVGCSALESLDISGWNTARLTNAYQMFAGCQALTAINGIEEMDVSHLEDAAYMFNYTGFENMDLSQWNTANLQTTYGMFDYCQDLKTIDLTGWNTDALTSISSMFSDCSALTTITGIEQFNTANVQYMSYTFSGCSSLESLDLSRWDTSKVWAFTSMFYNCTNLRDLNVNNFDVTGVYGEPGRYRYDLVYMFEGCSSLTTLDLSQWNTSQVVNMADMFSGCTSLEAVYVGEGWNTDNVEVGTAYYQTSSMFEGCTAIIGEDGTTYDETDYSIARAHYNEGGYLRRHHTEYTVTIPASGIGTFSAGENVTLSEGLTAYYCADFDGTRDIVRAKAIDGDIIPATTGVLVKGTPGETYTLYVTAEDAPSVNGNALVAVTVPTHVAPTVGENTNFMLKGGRFIAIAEAEASSKMPANKAYLQLPTGQLNIDAAGAAITLVWDETTGIDHSPFTSSQSSSDGYDLQGRRIKAPAKGVYIKDGKKLLVK